MQMTANDEDDGGDSRVRVTRWSDLHHRWLVAIGETGRPPRESLEGYASASYRGHITEIIAFMLLQH